ncbi:hypothetical protein I302_106059 [Kwoniella bestiolae CBS 10118]|uniref:Zn(2)-C6 fungal-type domain-containing protein n=1 Tax=Kwoniella bestiolae CBS 10118 TaxID=1296100 RepID=A0A1B9G2X2_9TREE|nr:hypothetical protein I302_05184 [Kwoniella bestiolae CBS 10118]OCF25365.1 hypothetical protein I302_05184 [Kwoniella bestiolae CBS 10118]
MDNSPYSSIIPPDRRGPTALPRHSYNSNVGGGEGAEGGRRNDGDGSSNLGDRNFPQNTQATLPQQYQHFSAFGPPTSTPASGTGIQPLRTLPPGPSFLSSYNAPHFRSSPHGYPETMPQLPSPLTSHRYEYPLQSYQSTTASSGGPGGIQPWQYGGPSRRRESMPDMVNKDTSHPLFSNRPMVGGSGSDFTSPTLLGSDGGNGLQQYVHSLTGLVQTSPVQASPATLGIRTWQPMSSVPPQPPTSSAPTTKRKRARASTFGSRTTDDDESQTASVSASASVPPNAANTSVNSVDEDELASSVAGENIAQGNQPPITAKDFSKQLVKSSVEAETSGSAQNMDVEEGQEGDEKLDHRKRKRNRTIRSCVPCHNHKRRCDRKRPCGRCTALGLTGTCVYEIDEARDMNDPEVAETERLRRRIAELEQVVRDLRQKAPTRAQAQLAAITSADPASSSAVIEESAGEDKKRRVIVDRFARFKLDEAKDVENSAAAAGMALDKNPSGPPIHHATADYKSEPYQTYLLPGEEMSSDKTGRKVFLGASTGKSMLRRLRELAKDKGDGQLLSVPEDVAFTGVFPDLRKTYPFTTIWSHENFSAEIIGLLPSPEQAELLWQAWEEEHAVYFHPFHMPTIHAEYSAFFAMSTQDKMNIPLSSLALHLIICALGCVIRATCAELFGNPDVSMARNGHVRKLSKDQKDLTSSRLQSELYLSASFQALRLCAYLANPTMRTVQAQLLQMVYLLASERASDAWTTGGTLVKQAIALGLHKDPLSLDPKISMRDAEIRRRLWWSIAGFECMLSLFFGRPSTISYYSTNLPQDRPDANLSELPGSAQQYLPPSNVLSNETTEQTYHAAFYQLTIPSFELLDRIFTVDRRFSRSTIYGWFSPPPKDSTEQQSSSSFQPSGDNNQHTYQDAIRLAQDISQWYSHLPSGMKFSGDDTPEYLLGSRNRRQLNQTLILSMKTWSIVMVLHRPYLRLDPTAYPESTEICSQAAHLLLRTYKSMADTKSTLAWSFWTMHYRAFQAGAVCAFLAIRQPGTEIADKCLNDLQGVIRVFEDRLSTWNVSHPVQADLCEGLVQLEKLVTAATQQRNTPLQQHTATASSSHSSMSPNMFGMSPKTFSDSSFTTPLSQIQAFPPVSLPTPANAGSGNPNFYSNFSNGLPTGNQTHNHNHSTEPRIDPMSGGTSGNINGNGNGDLGGQMNADFNGPEPLALPQFWASMFGIKMDKAKEPAALGVQNSASASGNGSW